MYQHRPRPKSLARLPTAASLESRADAVARLLGDRVRQGLSRRVSDPVLVAQLATALKNGNGAGRRGGKHGKTSAS